MIQLIIEYGGGLDLWLKLRRLNRSFFQLSSNCIIHHLKTDPFVWRGILKSPSITSVVQNSIPYLKSFVHIEHQVHHHHSRASFVNKQLLPEVLRNEIARYAATRPRPLALLDALSICQAAAETIEHFEVVVSGIGCTSKTNEQRKLIQEVLTRHGKTLRCWDTLYPKLQSLTVQYLERAKYNPRKDAAFVCNRDLGAIEFFFGGPPGPCGRFPSLKWLRLPINLHRRRQEILRGNKETPATRIIQITHCGIETHHTRDRYSSQSYDAIIALKATSTDCIEAHNGLPLEDCVSTLR